MAIKGCRTQKTSTNTTIRSSGDEVTEEEFKEWLMSFDADGDGRINREELRRALRSIHLRFSGRKSRRGMEYADADADGFVDDAEIDNLVEFARRRLGLRIVVY